MMEPDDTGRVNQHVPSLLSSVCSGYPRKTPPERFTGIGPHGRESPEVPESGRVHAVRAVEPPFGVDEERPSEPGLVQILAGLRRSLERHHEGVDLEPLQLLTRLLQLQQVSATRQSEQMPVEHQQQPAAAVLLEAMLPVLGVPQRKRHCGSADEVCHGRLGRHPWPRGSVYFRTNLCSAGLTVSATQMSPFGAIVM